MRIPETKIEEIRALADIVDVVGDYVALKPRGSNFVGLCPFHSEKTPSFNVNPERSIYKCFGCGKGGDVFSFIREIEHVSYPESVRMLAERVGVELPEEEREEPSSDAEPVWAALRFAGRYFYENLLRDGSAPSEGLRYFEARGYRPETIKRFGLGYARAGWDNLIGAAERAHVKTDYLHRAGLVIRRDDATGYYDRFRHRAMFPLFSHLGKVVGFAGRVLSDQKDQPKYINTPETEVYHKAETLYGLHQGRSEIRKREEVYLVEGYTDVLTLFQAGVTNVVATCGTSLTHEQIRLVGRYAKTILLVFDADSAGAGASIRAIDMILSAGLSVQVVSLPEGADPDAFVRQFDGAAFRRYAEKYRRDFVAFKLELARKSGALDTPENKLAAIRDLLGSVAVIDNPILQGEYLGIIGEALRIADSDLRNELAQILAGRRRQERQEVERARLRQERSEGPTTQRPAGEPRAPGAASESSVLPEERLLLRLMLQRGDHVVEFVLSHTALEEFSEGPVRDIVRALVDMFEKGEVRVEPFLAGSFGDAAQQLAADVLSERYGLSANWEQKLGMPVPKLDENPEKAAASAIRLLKRDRVETAIRELQGRMYSLRDSEADAEELLSEMQALQRLKRAIDRDEWMDRNGT